MAAPTTGAMIAAISSEWAAVSTSKLFWDDANTRLGIGDATPSYTLDVNGSMAANYLHLYQGVIELNVSRSGDNAGYIDIRADNTYTDYGLRIYKEGGANAAAYLQMRGTGGLNIQCIEAGAIWFYTNGANVWYFTNGGHLTPNLNKTYNIGNVDKRVNTICYATATTGTSRVVKATTICPICNQQMTKGTGSMVVCGEDEDYEFCFCLTCGIAGIEKQRHQFDKETLKHKKVMPPKVIFKGFRVLENGGMSRKIHVDFWYGDSIQVERPRAEKDTGPIEYDTEWPLHNSTMFGEEEYDNFLNMTEAEQEEYLYQLGLREWYALEEVKIMRNKTDKDEKVVLKVVEDKFKETDLHSKFKTMEKYNSVK